MEQKGKHIWDPTGQLLRFCRLGRALELLPGHFLESSVCFHLTFLCIRQAPKRSPALLSAGIFAEPMTVPAVPKLSCLRSQERYRLSLGACLEDVAMPHFQTKDQEETSRKQNRFYRGECRRITGRDLQVCPGFWEPWIHSQLPAWGVCVSACVRAHARARVPPQNSLCFHKLAKQNPGAGEYQPHTRTPSPE